MHRRAHSHPVGATPPTAGSSRGGPAATPRGDEVKLCGLAAVRARFARDAASIHRLYFDYATGRKIGVMCKALAAAKKVYRCVEPAELEKIAGTVHHGGVVAVATARRVQPVTEADVTRWATQRTPLLLLDRVGNPHNLGAIARTAAFFGVADIIVPQDPAAAVPSDAAYRVAEGGMEAVTVFSVSALPALMKALAERGYEVVGAATRGARPETIRTDRTDAAVALVLGNEEHGLAENVMAACTRLVTLPGRETVESLNVSVAAAILVWEFFGRRARRH